MENSKAVKKLAYTVEEMGGNLEWFYDETTEKIDYADLVKWLRNQAEDLEALIELIESGDFSR